MKHRHVLLMLAVILPFAAACEDDDDDVELAVFRASLVQVNSQVLRSAPAAVAEVIVEDDDAVQIRVEGLALDAVTHPIFLRAGAGCPTQVLDVNDDGVVDVIEGEAAYGTVLLPFDADVTTQAIEVGTFPTGSDFSYFALEEFDDVMEAVEGPDENPNDFLVPLTDGESLDLERRTVVVHGVGMAAIEHPEQLQGLDGMEISTTVPILCGRLSRVE